MKLTTGFNRAHRMALVASVRECYLNFLQKVFKIVYDYGRKANRKRT